MPYRDQLEKLTKYQRVQYAIFCAELALPAFEKKHPKDLQPREAIKAAKKWLKNPCDEITDDDFAAHNAAAVLYSHANAAAVLYSHANATADYGSIGPVTHTVPDANATDDRAIERYLREIEACTKND